MEKKKKKFQIFFLFLGILKKGILLKGDLNKCDFIGDQMEEWNNYC